MVRQRLVDRPDAPARARAGGRPRASRGSPSGDGRSRRTRRPHRPRPCAPAAARRRGTSRARGRCLARPRRVAARRPATPSALAALCRPAVGSRIVTARSWPSSPRDLEGRSRRGSAATIRARTVAASAPRRHRPGATVSTPRSRELEACQDRGDSRVADVGDDRSRPRAHAGQPRGEGVAHGLVIGEDVGVVPLGGREDGDRRPIRVEVAGVLVGLDDERRSPARARRRRRRRRSAPPAAARRRTPRGRARRRRARGRASRRSCSCRACRRPRRASGRPPRRRRPAATARPGCPGPARRASSGWSGSIAVSALVTASRSGGGRVVTWAGSWPATRDGSRRARAPRCRATDRRRRRP